MLDGVIFLSRITAELNANNMKGEENWEKDKSIYRHKQSLLQTKKSLKMTTERQKESSFIKIIEKTFFSGNFGQMPKRLLRP